MIDEEVTYFSYMTRMKIKSKQNKCKSIVVYLEPIGRVRGSVLEEDAVDLSRDDCLLRCNITIEGEK